MRGLIEDFLHKPPSKTNQAVIQQQSFNPKILEQLWILNNYFRQKDAGIIKLIQAFSTWEDSVGQTWYA